LTEPVRGTRPAEEAKHELRCESSRVGVTSVKENRRPCAVPPQAVLGSDAVRGEE